jgi:hypothetical protein
MSSHRAVVSSASPVSRETAGAIATTPAQIFNEFIGWLCGVALMATLVASAWRLAT